MHRGIIYASEMEMKIFIEKIGIICFSNRHSFLLCES